MNLNKDIINLFNSIHHQNLNRIYPENIFCDSTNCSFRSEDVKVLYYDNLHLSKFGAQKISNEILNVKKTIKSIQNE